MRPEGFHQHLSEKWSLWVLTNGLPELPGPDLPVGHSVPVSYWIGPNTAAVLHIRRILDTDEDEPFSETDVHLFCLIGSRWQSWGGGGGGWAGSSQGWEAQSQLARMDVPAAHVNLHGMNSGGSEERGCKALWGSVGTSAAVAEVTQDGQVTRRPVEAPVGAFVVCADYTLPFTVRVYDALGELLHEIQEPAGFEDEPPWVKEAQRDR